MANKRSPYKLPRTVNVLGTDFTITEDSSMPPEEYGECDGKAYSIKLNPLHRVSYRQSLTHELVHAALAISGMSEVLDEKTEEAIAVCLEHAFAAYTDFSQE